MRIPALAALSALWLVALMAPAALAFDAGGFAFQQRQHSLQRQQAGVDDDPAAEADGTLPAGTQEAMLREMEELKEQARAELQPEYERRVAADGQEAADQWLTAEAQARGEQAGRYLREKYGLD
ncbi:MAG TPA: hypothetical protein VNS22_17190 [Geminicoccus sp.]|uniref:hypothetical protein n=1 Tax=Geminicoccus sp. TaxID=2024832 RepID=UPI002C0C0402|nr:hypothetical protein [Geminicoccus sp.]HWL70102.1 hypothetical protein [Geminicoccus sp.]